VLPTPETATQVQEPSAANTIDSLKNDLAKVVRQNKLLTAKLRKERDKLGRLQPIVAHLENLDHVAMGDSLEMSRWKKRKNDNHRFHGLIHAAIDLVIKEDRNFCRWKDSRLTLELSYAFSSYNNGICDNELTILYKEKIRKRYFDIFEILQAMDLAGGVCSYTAYDIIRSVVLAVDKNNIDDDDDTSNSKRTGLCLMPSTTKLKRAAAYVEKVGQTLTPLIHQPEAPAGESIQFKYDETIKFILKSFSLYGTDCTIAHSLDGAQLSKRESHTCAGIKIIDQKAIDPRTGSLMFEDPKDAKFQGLDHLFPMKMVMARETNKLVYEEFGDFYAFCSSCEHDDSNPYAPSHPKTIFTAECDLSMTWKGLARGGAAKIKEFACHCCDVEVEELAEPHTHPCNRICRQLHEAVAGWECYHRPIVGEAELERKKIQLQLLRESLKSSIDTIAATSKMKVENYQNPPPGSSKNIRSIFYDPTNSKRRLFYLEFLQDELRLRGLSPLGSLGHLRILLKAELLKEDRIRKNIRAINHMTEDQGALFLLMQAVPCLLHMENRCGLKLLTMLLIEGLDSAISGGIYGDEKSEQKRIDRFLEEVEKIVNESILGDPQHRAHWYLPYDQKAKEIAPITMDNGRVRKLMDGLEKMILVCIADGTERAKWEAMMPYYRRSFVLLRTRHDMSNEEIESFQYEFDHFFQIWVGMYGDEGVTNYLHMLASGHIMEYLFKYKNLYRHSQQGWEALNHLLKTFYFRRTGRGGGKYKRHKLLSIGRWLQRRMLWLCGWDERKMIAHLAILEEDRTEDTAAVEMDNPRNNGEVEVEDVLDMGLDIGESTWL
jgi:hypothetical protein